MNCCCTSSLDLGSVKSHSCLGILSSTLVNFGLPLFPMGLDYALLIIKITLLLLISYRTLLYKSDSPSLFPSFKSLHSTFSLSISCRMSSFSSEGPNSPMRVSSVSCYFLSCYSVTFRLGGIDASFSLITLSTVFQCFLAEPVSRRFCEILICLRRLANYRGCI